MHAFLCFCLMIVFISIHHSGQTILPPGYFRVFVVKDIQEPLLAKSMLCPGYHYIIMHLKTSKDESKSPFWLLLIHVWSLLVNFLTKPLAVHNII